MVRFYISTIGTLPLPPKWRSLQRMESFVFIAVNLKTVCIFDLPQQSTVCSDQNLENSIALLTKQQVIVNGSGGVINGSRASSFHWWITASTSSHLFISQTNKDLLMRLLGLFCVLSLTIRPVDSRQKFDRYLSRLFHERADRNKDGSICFDECYENLLIFYTYLNQWAPIPPPRRDRVEKLYASADWNHKKGLQEAEFKLLAGAFAARATLRVIIYKVVTWIGAPLLSAAMISLLEHTETVTSLKAWAKNMFFLPEAVTQRTFWMAAFLIMNVSNLGMLVLFLMDWALDHYKPFATAWFPEKMPPPPPPPTTGQRQKKK